MLAACAQHPQAVYHRRYPGSKVASVANLQVSPEHHPQPVAAPGQEEGPWEDVPQEGAVCGVPDGAGRRGHCCLCCAVVHVIHVGLWAEGVYIEQHWTLLHVQVRRPVGCLELQPAACCS